MDAWRRQDVAAYLSSYAPDFTMPGKKRAAWEAERRQRLTHPVFIRVSADALEVHDAASARPSVSFIQHYESESYEEKSRKVLTFVKVAGRWLIEREENSVLPRS